AAARLEFFRGLHLARMSIAMQPSMANTLYVEGISSPGGIPTREHRPVFGVTVPPTHLPRTENCRPLCFVHVEESHLVTADLLPFVTQRITVRIRALYAVQHDGRAGFDRQIRAGSGDGGSIGLRVAVHHDL